MSLCIWGEKSTLAHYQFFKGCLLIWDDRSLGLSVFMLEFGPLIYLGHFDSIKPVTWYIKILCSKFLKNVKGNEIKLRLEK